MEPTSMWERKFSIVTSVHVMHSDLFRAGQKVNAVREMWQLFSQVVNNVGTLMELQLTWQCSFPWLWACFDCWVDNIKPKSFKTERPGMKRNFSFVVSAVLYLINSTTAMCSPLHPFFPVSLNDSVIKYFCGVLLPSWSDIQGQWLWGS